jgi:hypothetical protein
MSSRVVGRDFCNALRKLDIGKEKAVGKAFDEFRIDRLAGYHHGRAAGAWQRLAEIRLHQNRREHEQLAASPADGGEDDAVGDRIAIGEERLEWTTRAFSLPHTRNKLRGGLLQVGDCLDLDGFAVPHGVDRLVVAVEHDRRLEAFGVGEIFADIAFCPFEVECVVEIDDSLIPCRHGDGSPPQLGDTVGHAVLDQDLTAQEGRPVGLPRGV